MKIKVRNNGRLLLVPETKKEQDQLTKLRKEMGDEGINYGLVLDGSITCLVLKPE